MKTKRVSYMVTDEDADRIEKISKLKSCHKSYVVRAAIRLLAEKLEKNPDAPLTV